MADSEQNQTTGASGGRRRGRLAVVFGGTGAVGSAVLQALRAASVPAIFTYLRSEERAQALAAELGHEARRVDLGDAAAVGAFLESVISASAEPPDLFVHCAAHSRAVAMPELSAQDFDLACAVNGRAAFLAVRALGAAMGRAGGGDLVLCTALDRGQSLPLPVHYAATQGLLGALAMAAGKELGPLGVRINAVALGPLGSGLSESLDARSRQDFEQFSALRRCGRPEEAARAILWLLLRNTYMNGRTLAANGGL